MIAAEDEGDRLTEDELVEQLILLYVAGHETTVNLIGNGTLALHARTATSSSCSPTIRRVEATMADELLRYDSPVQMSRRVTLVDYEVDGHAIEAGTLLMTCLGSANRDPAKWGDTADTLDLRRADANQHMSFGGGVHSCLGAHLARLEGRRSDHRLVRRFPNARTRDRSARVERPHRAARADTAPAHDQLISSPSASSTAGASGDGPLRLAPREADHAMRGPVVVRRIRPVLERVVVVGVPLDDDGEFRVAMAQPHDPARDRAAGHPHAVDDREDRPEPTLLPHMQALVHLDEAATRRGSSISPAFVIVLPTVNANLLRGEKPRR